MERDGKFGCSEGSLGGIAGKEMYIIIAYGKDSYYRFGKSECKINTLLFIITFIWYKNWKLQNCLGH